MPGRSSARSSPNETNGDFVPLRRIVPTGDDVTVVGANGIGASQTNSYSSRCGQGSRIAYRGDAALSCYGGGASSDIAL